MKTLKTTAVIAILVLMAGVSEAKTVRATEMSSTLWSDMAKGTLGDIVIEFHQGDELPVTFSAEGDLLETTQAATSYVGVKKNFWVRVQKNNIQMSFDNITYKPISDVLGGSFEAGAGSDQNGGIANAINLTLKAYLK